MAQVYVLGGSGFGGGELLRLLFQHPHVDSVRSVSHTHAGRPISEVHPNLRSVAHGVFEPEPDWTAFSHSEAPVVFSAMPHFQLASQLPDIEEAWARNNLQDRVTLIDLSGDFRLDDAIAYERAYGRTHPNPRALSTFVYGLPEWRRKSIVGAQRIANPGCFATAIQLALLPLAGMKDLGFLAISAATGSSGSGAAPGATTHHPIRAHDFRAYKVLRHQHEAELVRLLDAEGSTGYKLAFVPQSAPLVRGIFATIQLRAPHAMDLKGGALSRHYAAFYEGTPFVRLVEESPRLAAVTGSNFCDVAVHENAGCIVILAALDNLVKGMAGQAIQNMNIALGFPEAAGLSQVGLYPA